MLLRHGQHDIELFAFQPSQHLRRREVEQLHSGVGVGLGEIFHGGRENSGRQRGRVADPQPLLPPRATDAFEDLFGVLEKLPGLTEKRLSDRCQSDRVCPPERSP